MRASAVLPPLLSASLAAASVLPSNSSSSSSKQNVYDVLILGAGISGISAARTLIQDHKVHNIAILEARDVVGGRAYPHHLTNPSTNQTVTVEKGCNWIQGPEREPIDALAQKWGIHTVEQDYDSTTWFDSASSGFVPEDKYDDFMAPYDELLETAPVYAEKRINASQVDLSARAGASIVGYRPRTALERAYEWYNIDFTFAQPPELCSFYETFGAQENPLAAQDLLVADPRGYKYMFEAEFNETLGAKGINDPRLHLNTLVTKIDYAEGTKRLVKVHTNKGVFKARHVIHTFSLGTLQTEEVEFEPPLPEWKKEAIYNFGMTVYQKFFMLFPSKFWSDDQFIVYADQEDRGRFPLWQNLEAPGFLNGSDSSGYVLFVTAVDNEARRLELSKDEVVVAEAMEKLREMYGADIPEPLDVLIPRWSADPLFRGSYSNWPLGVLEEHHHNLRTSLASGALHFTGEAMAEEAFGYVQGAWNEGQATAKKVATCLKKGKCAPETAFESINTCPQDGTVLAKRALGRAKRTSRRPSRRYSSKKGWGS